MMRAWWCFLATFSFLYSMGISPKTVVLLERTDSNQLLKINIGSQEGVQKNDYGVLLAVVKSKGERKLVPFTRMKLIALNESQSIWRTITIFRDYLKEGGKYLFIGLGELQKGKKSLSFVTRGYIDKETPASKREFLNQQNREFSERLDMVEREKLHKVREWIDGKNQVELSRFSRMTKDNKRILTLLQALPILELRDKYKLETYEKMVLSYLEKVNNPMFQGDLYYAHHMRTEDGLVDERKRREYKKYLKKRMASLSEEEKNLLSFWKKDNNWSSGMSDEDLAVAIELESELHEKKRQNDTFLNRYSWQVYGGINLNLINNENTSDTKNKQDRKIAYDIGAEFYLFRNNLRFRNFSVLSELRIGQDGLSVALSNALQSEVSVAAGFNWYPFTSSGGVLKPVFFIGPHFRLGQSTLKINDPNPESNKYSQLGAGFRMGFLYRWSSRWGVTAHMNIERNYLSLSGNLQSNQLLAKSLNYPYMGIGLRLNYTF